VGDRRDAEDGEIVRRRVEAGVIAERPFETPLAQVYIALDDDLSVGRGLNVLGDALDEGHRLAAQPARQQVLVNAGRQRGRSAPRLRRVAAEGDGAGNALLLVGTRFALVIGAPLVPLPVHAQRAPVELLQAVHAHIARAGHRIAGDDLRQGDVRPTVVRPAGKDRQQIERRILGDDHFLARRAADAARPQADAAQRGQHLAPALDQRAHALRQARIDQLAQPATQVFEIVHAQGQGHAPRRAEGIDQHGHGAAGHILEEQRLVLRVRPLADPIGDLGDLQVGAHRRADAHQFAFRFQAREKVAQIGIRHRWGLSVVQGSLKW